MSDSYLDTNEYKEFMVMLDIIKEKAKNKPLEHKKLLLEEFLIQYKKLNFIVENIEYYYYNSVEKFLVSMKFKNKSRILELDFKL